MIVILVFVCLIGISGSVFLMPSYILSSYREAEIKSQIDSVEASLDSAKQPELNQKLVSFNTKIASVSVPADSVELYDVIQKILAIKPAGISVQSILVLNKIVGEGAVTIQVSGVADTRDSLVDFHDTLKADTYYSSVKLPIENLALEMDAPFTLSITIKYEK